MEFLAYSRLLVTTGLFLSLGLLAGCPQSSSNDSPAQGGGGQFTGNYLIQQVGRNTTGLYTTQVAVTSNGDGTGTYNILAHSQGVTTPTPVPFTYSTAGDGTFTINNGTSDDYGVLSSDGNKMIIVDATKNPPDTDNEIIFSLALKSDCTVTKGLAGGSYQEGRFEINPGGLVPISTAIVDVGYANAGGVGTYNYVQHSGGFLGGDNLTFTQNPADCTITVNDGIGDDKYGLATADGSMYVLIDTNNTNVLLSLAIGVRKSSANDNTLLNGSYRLGVFAEETQAAIKTIFSSEVKVTSAGDGTATADVIRDSMSPPASGIPLTYVVNADGTFSVTTVTATDYGIVSATGDFFVLVDAANNPPDTDDSIMLTAGIRP